jgi:hypothetical protein
MTNELKRRANGSTISTFDMGNFFFIGCNFFLPLFTDLKLLPPKKKDPSKMLLTKRMIVF